MNYMIMNYVIGVLGTAAAFVMAWGLLFIGMIAMTASGDSPGRISVRSSGEVMVLTSIVFIAVSAALIASNTRLDALEAAIAPDAGAADASNPCPCPAERATP